MEVWSGRSGVTAGPVAVTVATVPSEEEVVVQLCKSLCPGKGALLLV